MNKKNLRMGSTGDEVRELQEILQQLGYRIQDTPGSFGHSTRSAVRAFQNDHRIIMDGIVGSVTWNVISRILLYMPQKPEQDAASPIAAPVSETVHASAQVPEPEQAPVPASVSEPVPAPVQVPMAESAPVPTFVSEPAPVPVQFHVPGPSPMPVWASISDMMPISVQTSAADMAPTDVPTAVASAFAVENSIMDMSTPVFDIVMEPALEPVASSWTMVWNEGSPAVSAQAEARPTLRQGNSGDYVTELQNRLRDLGYFTVTPTGYFGTVTRAAVIAFQQDQGLAADGIVGPLTWAALDTAGIAPPSETPSAGRPVLRFGSRGEHVTQLQEMLNTLGYNAGPADGIFGNRTQEAVREFQDTRGLIIDGIVGSLTWAALDEAIAELEAEREQQEDIEEGVRPILREGDTGEYVRILQEKLKLLGYFSGSVTASFGHETTEAVMDFQRASGLTADGIAGPQLWAALESATPVPPEFEGETPGGPRPTLRYGDSGSYVAELQRELTALLYYTGPISGYFDNDTLTAVKAFQDTNRLTPDGVVGRSTWNALISLFPPPVVC